MEVTIFQSLAEVRAYLGGDSIECLICHKRFGRLTRTHLRMHDMYADEYRAVFGIPWSFSLTCPRSRQATTRANLANNTVSSLGDIRGAKLGQKYPNRRPRTPATIERWRNYSRPKGSQGGLHGEDGRFVPRTEDRKAS